MSKRTSYHHGNLRDALLKAAIRLIAEVGPTAFTLREVARRAGVSHNAPYRHFRNKEDLTSAVAIEGFHELTSFMLDAAKQQSSPLDRLKHAGLAYITFALRRPEHFTVMFEEPLSRQKNPATDEAAKQSFSTLVGFIEACQRENQLPSGDPLSLALLAWTMVHGIAKLAITERLPFRSKTEILRFAASVIDQSLPTLR